MSRRGEITVACDSPDCHASRVLTVQELSEYNIDTALDWWQFDDANGRDICPQCDEEIGDEKRCDACLKKIEQGTICGDCYGGTERDPSARSWETAAWPFDRMN